MESNRARAQNTTLSLVIVHVDRGGELLRQHGDAAVDHYIEQLARALSSAIRQTDIAVKYTAWSLVFILPDTPADSAHALAEKLRQVAETVRPSWGAADTTISAVVAEASARPGDETEDRVTEWMNRAEAGLDEARQRGGNTFVALATLKGEHSGAGRLRASPASIPEVNHVRNRCGHFAAERALAMTRYMGAFDTMTAIDLAAAAGREAIATGRRWRLSSTT